MTDETIVHVAYKDKREGIGECGSTEGKCPACGTVLETGFGLAGGGMGVYEYCPNESCDGGVVTKTITEG